MCLAKRRTTLIVPRTSAIRPRSFASFNSTTSITHVSGPQGGAPHEGHVTRSCTRCTIVVCAHVVGTYCAERTSFFFLLKDVVHVVLTPSHSRAPPKGFKTYANSALKTAWFGLGGTPLAIVAGD